MIYQLVFVLIIFFECSHFSGIVHASNRSHNRIMLPHFKLSPDIAGPYLSCASNVTSAGFGQDLQRELKACQWKRFVLVTQGDVHKNFVEHIRQTFTSGPLSSVLSYEVAMKTMEVNKIADIIWEAYFEQRIFNFIWITKQQKEIMVALHHLFHQKSCGYGALMTSRMNVIFVSFNTDISAVALDIECSLFDNLAVFAFSENPPALERVYTHMWRIDRSRELQEMRDFGNVLNDEGTAMCKVFPNIKNGFNGRHLTGLAKEWLPEFYKARNEVTGDIEYSGFYIDVFDTLASTLNFTYTLVPPAESEDNMTWTAYTEMVSNCTVDFGINLFTNNAVFHYNTTTSFPVLYSNFIGAYINRSKPDPYKIFLVFKLETYLVIIGLLLVTALFYLLLNHVLLLPEDSLSLPEGQINDHSLLTNQILKSSIQRPSDFEADWQSKYKNLEIAELSTFDQMGLDRERQTYCKNNLHYKTKFLQRLIHWLKKISSLQLSLKCKKPESLKNCFVKCYSSKIKKSSRQKNFTSDRMKTNFKVQGRTTCNRTRECIYNNSSHYITEYVSKHCYVSFEYKTYQPVIPLQNVEAENTKKGDGKHSLKTLGARIWETIRLRQQYIFGVYFGFLGTIAGQGTLPEAVHWTPRVLLAAWSFMMVILVATYNGNLTATFVDTAEEVPIKSFDDLISKGEYRWGTWNETLMYSLLAASGRGTTLRELYEGIDRFSKTDPSVLGSLSDLIAHIKSGKFVALISSFVFEYLEEYTDLPGLTVIPEILLTANGGFVFPDHSELNLAISRQLLAMRDSGVTNHIFQRLRIRFNTTMKVNEESSNDFLNMENVAGVFFISGYGVIISLVALVIEILVSKFQKNISLSTV